MPLVVALALMALPLAAQDGAAQSGPLTLTPGMLGQEAGPPAPGGLSNFLTGTSFSGHIETGWTFNFRRS